MTPVTTPTYRLWVNEDRTVLVRMWASGDLEVALREHPDEIWKPPIHMTPEKTT